MAEKLKTFEFQMGPRPGSRGAYGSKYDRYLDGEVYRLRAPKDMLNAHSAASYLRKLARRRGLKIHVAIESESALVVQAYTPEAGE
jgi:hypothetical protein